MVNPSKVDENVKSFVDAYGKAMALLDREIDISDSNDDKYRLEMEDNENEKSLENIDFCYEDGIEVFMRRPSSRRLVQDVIGDITSNDTKDRCEMTRSIIKNSIRNLADTLNKDILEESPEIRRKRLSEMKNPGTTPEEEDISWSDAAQVVSKLILAGVNLVKGRVESKIEKVSHEIENSGEVLKENMTAVAQSNERKTENAQEVVILEYSEDAKSTSHGLRDATTKITLGLRDVVTNKIVEIADTMEEAEVGKMIIPDEEDREILGAVGKVALAGLGAAQISFEIMFDSAEAVAVQTNRTAADVIRYRYGSIAGKVAEDTGDSIYNTFRAVKLLGLLSPEAMAVAVVKSTGKAKLTQ